MISSHSSLILLYLFFGLVLGAVLTYFLSRYLRVDYSVLLFVTGVVTAVVAGQLSPDNYSEKLFESILQWEGIDPNLIIFVFLPVLLFGEAQTLSFHHVKKVFWPSFLLAVPGAVLSAWLLALIVKSTISPGWDWSLCWLFGSILCATDPVAVVAVLKTVTVNSTSHKRLTYLIIGETLLNDGSALVLYGIIGSKSANAPGGNVVQTFAYYFLKVLLVSFSARISGRHWYSCILTIARQTPQPAGHDDADCQYRL